MTNMFVRITNSSFESISYGSFDSVEEAYKSAVLSGVAIGADELNAGVSSVIIQIAVGVVGQSTALRGSVAISTAPLLSTASE